MLLTQKLCSENSASMVRLVQNCKTSWVAQNSPQASNDSQFGDFHNTLWNKLSQALATGNNQVLLDLFRNYGKEMARQKRPLPQVVERSGQCLQGLMQEVLLECDANPEFSTNPKALRQFLSRFNQTCSHINTALVQGYTEQIDAAGIIPNHVRPKTRLEQRSEAIELFKQLSAVTGTGQFMINRYRANNPLFNGSAARQNCFYFIREGTVQLQEFLPDGRAVVLAILGKGDVFARTTPSSETGYFRDFHAVALRDTEVVLLEEEALRLAMEKSPRVAMGIIKSFSSQIADIQQVIEGLLSRDIAARLTHVLLQLADEFGEARGEGTLIDYPLTHQQLADMLGSNRVTITRRLGDLQKQGLLEVNRHSIVIFDREGLEKIAC